MGLKELRRVCEAATTEPYGWGFDGLHRFDAGPAALYEESVGQDSDQIEKNLTFIEIFNPATIAKLLDVVEAANRLVISAGPAKMAHPVYVEKLDAALAALKENDDG